MKDELLGAVRQSLLCLLEETLHSHQGVYLEEGTSLLETLDSLDAAVASRAHDGLPQTIAGHANHLRYYLANTLQMLKGQGNGDFDVAESWKVGTVIPAEWEELKTQIRATRQELLAFVSQAPENLFQGGLPALLGMIAHSAYHLGALRQLVAARG